MKRTLTTALALAAFTFAGSLPAQDRNREFDRLVRQAGTAYDAHDAPAAIAALERAYAIRPVGRLLFNIGRAHELNNDFATAADYYRRFLATNPDGQSATVAREALGIAERRAAQQAEERRQREAAQQAEAHAQEEARQRAAAAEQQRLEDERRRRLAVSSPRRITVPVAVAGGVAGAALIAGGVLGGLALSAQSTFNSNRDGATRYDASSQGGAMALGADISFGVALAAGVTGLVLFLTQSTTPATTSERAP